MIVFFVMIFITTAGIHTFSYGVYLVKKEKNALAAFGTILLALITVAAPTLILLLKF